MSWMPSADPLLGDKRSCDALELVIVPRVRDTLIHISPKDMGDGRARYVLGRPCDGFDGRDRRHCWHRGLNSAFTVISARPETGSCGARFRCAEMDVRYGS